MDITRDAILVVAAFGASTVNAVAGGGSLISFPALIWAGYGARVANVTNTVALVPGYVGGSVGYRSEISRQPGNVVAILAPTLLGAIAGSAILLSTSEASFKAIVPFLIYAGCALLALQDRIGLFFRKRSGASPGWSRLPGLEIALFFAAVYGAYFGAGMGIIVLATLGLFLPDDIQRSNALKGIVSLLVNGLAAAYFALFADVAWSAAALMALAALAGGFTGVRIARRLKRELLRFIVVSYGTVAATVLLLTR